jgi:hypothetical protein
VKKFVHRAPRVLNARSQFPFHFVLSVEDSPPVKMAVFYAPIPEAAVLERLQDGIWDAGMQVEEDFHCLATVIAQNAWLMFLAACGISFLAVGLVAAAGLGLTGALLLATIPYIYVSYLSLKVIQRYRQRQLDHDNNDNFREPQLSMLDIVLIMHHHPRETFIPNNELDRSSKEQLNRMLMIRQQQQQQDEENNSSQTGETLNVHAMQGVQDRNNLVESVKKCRKYNETCAICFEDYEKGDCLRVISQCHHEFHDDCIIKWAGTFATSNSKRGFSPTCPLCNESLCRPCNVRVD